MDYSYEEFESDLCLRFLLFFPGFKEFIVNYTEIKTKGFYVFHINPLWSDLLFVSPFVQD